VKKIGKLDMEVMSNNKRLLIDYESN